jgi:hypothetical protein
MATQQIQVYSAAAIEYTWPTTITEKNGKDISGDTVTVSLGTSQTPGRFVAPDVVTRPTPSTVVVQMLIGGSYRPTAGAYWLWVYLPDTPEHVPRRGARIVIS